MEALFCAPIVKFACLSIGKEISLVRGFNENVKLLSDNLEMAVARLSDLDGQEGLLAHRVKQLQQLVTKAHSILKKVDKHGGLLKKFTFKENNSQNKI